ncbi:AAA family ATPase [Streptomyces sp. NPDC058375]|uniref:AAA family ATPase n=1 Tax=Streptomyces sp. NPDC058375 TaxID=3346467 RepID=UPI00365DF818
MSIENTTPENHERKLISVEVNQLLGRFDHRVEFPADRDFVILHGPNGIGKTKLLELIEATFSIDIYTISETPFRSVSLTFSDGRILSVERLGQEALPGLGEEEANSDSFIMRLLEPGRGEITWNASEAAQADPVPLTRFISQGDFPVRRLASGRWGDLTDGETLSTREVISRYRDLVPARYFGVKLEGVPQEISRLLEATKVHLIETQRLINVTYPSARGARESERRQPTVLEFSRDFSRRLDDALAQNSRVSQGLDRSFPRRLLSETELDPEITEEAIRERYSKQSDTRKRLTQISVLDASGELPLPDRELASWEKRVLWTYLNDTEQKLRTFQDLLDRVALLREIVNSRFLYKELILDREGFKVVTSTGKEIKASQLSSGEQHELVLTYDLLFNAHENSLVLIDEPEISLHVAWQKEFLNDIVRIAAINSSRFIVATHSPQIINKYWSQTVGLEPGYEDEALWVR